MEIKNVCNRCHENLIENGIFFKYGSANYCFDCHSKIYDEIEEDMVNEALNSIEKSCEKPKNVELVPFKKTIYISVKRRIA